MDIRSRYEDIADPEQFESPKGTLLGTEGEITPDQYLFVRTDRGISWLQVLPY